MKLSIVIPAYNEEKNVSLLHDEISAALKQIDSDYEIIFVDDGSTDGSRDIMRRLSTEGTRSLILGRKFGQTAALAAGLDDARGSIIITMDADGQNDPADIPRMVALLGEGYQVVSGWRFARKDGLLTRRVPSRLANALIAFVTGVRLHDFGCTLKVYDRMVLENVRLYGEMHRFIPALASWVGAEVTEVKVNHRPRLVGKSKYGIGRVVRVLLDLITVKFLLSYATRPIQVFGKMGLGCILAGVLSGVYVVYDKIARHHDMTGNPLFLLTVLLLVVGTQFISLGLLGEISIRTYHESQSKPVYFIKEKLG